MWQKIKCKLGFHDWKLEAVRCNVDGPECMLNYDEQTQSIYATVAINVVCKHCGKRLGSSIVRASYSAKELGLTKVKKKH